MENRNQETGAESGRKARVFPWIAAIVVLAFAIRLIYILQIAGNPLFEHPILDEKVNHEWAAQVAAGEPWSVDPRTGEAIPYFRAPLYIWFLGGIYALFGTDPGFAPRVIQSLLGALSCGLLCLLGTRLFSARIGITAGFGAAIAWILVYFDNELLIVPVIVFLDILLVLLLVAAYEKQRWRWWAAAGLVLGLSAIARPEILLFAPAVCLWILLLYRPPDASWKQRLGACAAFSLSLLVPILPVTARNLIVADDLVLIASQGGVNFYIGNNPGADGVTAVVPGTPPDWWGGYYATQAMAQEALGRPPKASEVSKYFTGLSLRFWSEHPRAALEGLGIKARAFLSRQEFANNKCIYTFVEDFAPITPFLPVGFWLVGPLGLLGLFIGLRCARRLFPLWGFITVYSLSVIVFFVTARFRAPVIPFLILCASFAAHWLIDRARRRELRKLVPAAAALAALFALVLFIPGGRGFAGPFKVTEDFYCTVGRELQEQREFEEALRYLDRSVLAAQATIAAGEVPARHVEHLRWVMASARHSQGEILEAQGRGPEAAAAFRKALDALPPSYRLPRLELLERLAKLLNGLGDNESAARYKREAANLRRTLPASRP